MAGPTLFSGRFYAMRPDLFRFRSFGWLALVAALALAPARGGDNKQHKRQKESVNTREEK